MASGSHAQCAPHRVARQVAPLAILLVVIGAVLGVAALRERADRARQTELHLERLQSDTALDLLAVADGSDSRATGSSSNGAARSRLSDLERSGDEAGARAERMERASDLGSLLVLLVAGVIVWLLLRQAGRARRQADQTNAELANQNRFRSLVQHSSDVITVTDAIGTIIYQSPSVTPVFGYESADLLGTDLQRLVHPDDVRSVVGTLIETAKHSRSERIECRVRHADGSWRHVESAVTARLDDPTVEGMVLNTRDITERKALEEQLAHQAFHDSLTGLANRVLFRDRVEHALARMRRQQRPMAVLLLDLDGFKNVNDSLGHAFGDAFLVAVADRLRNLLRPSDTPCRLGGDEFAVLIEDLTEAVDATIVAERILESLRMPFIVDGKEVVTAASCGITIAETTSRDADDLLRNADVAMYTAKSRGRNRYELFKPSMHQAMLDRLDLEADLRRALERNEFVLHYQPTVTLETGRISGMEALVRWNSPSRGMVPPGMFITVAEDTGLIVGLGAWVLEEACRQAVAWKQEFGLDAPQTMSVNLSARQLQDDGLVAEVATILRRTGIRPEHVVLEITESAVMADAEAMTARLHELKALGVRLAIDDFGTGYSSMSYLCSFPIDILKIDRSFVHGVRNEPQKMGIVRAIVELGHILDLQTVAEGIELDEELQELRALRCDLGQGFWFARPLTVDQAVAMLSDHAVARRRGEFALLPVPVAAG